MNVIVCYESGDKIFSQEEITCKYCRRWKHSFQDSRGRTFFRCPKCEKRNGELKWFIGGMSTKTIEPMPQRKKQRKNKGKKRVGNNTKKRNPIALKRQKHFTYAQDLDLNYWGLVTDKIDLCAELMN